MFSHGVPFWSVAFAGTQPLFDGITFYNKERSARAALRVAAAHSRNMGLAGFQNVADTLHAISTDTAAHSTPQPPPSRPRRSHWALRESSGVPASSTAGPAERGAGLSAGASRPRQQGVSTRQHFIKPWAAAGGTAVQARSASRRAPANPRHVCRHCTTDGAAATIVLVVASARPSDVSSVASAGHPFVTSRALLQRSEQKRSGLERQGRIRRPRPASGMDSRPKKHQQELELLR
jgi:hypothetical protein